MKTLTTLLKTGLLCAALIASPACTKKQLEEATKNIVLEGLNKDWNSSCMVGSDPVTGANHYAVEVAFSDDGSFSYYEYWYTGTCAGANYTMIYGSAGTYNVGSLVTGSTELFDLALSVTSSYMMAMTTTAQASVNTDCGGTSPYISGTSNSFNGVYKPTYMMSCMSMVLPNSGNKAVNNIVSVQNNTLAIGATARGIPGVFAGGSVPTTATLTFQ